MNRILMLSSLFIAVLTAQQPKNEAYRGGLVTPPLPKPKFTLPDTSGRPFDFAGETNGYVTLLFFGYTFCPDQCPMHMANIGAALKTLPTGVTNQIKMVFLTTDPARDTPLVLRRWLNLFDQRFIGLTGTETAIEAVQRATGVPVATRTRPAAGSANGNYGVAHANFVIAYSKDNLAHVIYPGGVGKEGWVHDLRPLIKETWMRRPD